MRVPDEVRARYPKFDPECSFFLDHFDEPVDSVVLEVGAHDAPLSLMLAHAGWRALSVDLRPYEAFDGLPPSMRHTHITGDFCALSDDFWRTWRGRVDCVIAVSSVEHFGLTTYDARPHKYLDVVAMRYAYDLLKDGGSCYLVVPFGGAHFEMWPHWRVYDWGSASSRLIQDFVLEGLHTRVMERYHANGKEVEVGASPTWPDLMCNLHGVPAVSALFKLRKRRTPRTFKKRES
jgi:hypothetical protein